MRRYLGLLLGLVLVALPSSAAASSITSNVAVDDVFTLYVSLDDSIAGTAVPGCVGVIWTTTVTCNFALTPGVTNYIHVQASDAFGPPSMFIGSFTIDDALFAFSNGTQALNTDATNWTVRSISFAGPLAAVVDIGADGTGPWGNRPSINDSARFIWDAQGGCDRCTRYFSTAVNPTGPQAVPEPGTIALLGLGLAGVAAARLRRRA